MATCAAEHVPAIRAFWPIVDDVVLLAPGHGLECRGYADPVGISHDAVVDFTVRTERSTQPMPQVTRCAVTGLLCRNDRGVLCAALGERCLAARPPFRQERLELSAVGLDPVGTGRGRV